MTVEQYAIYQRAPGGLQSAMSVALYTLAAPAGSDATPAG